jgi:hypothetical protein
LCATTGSQKRFQEWNKIDIDKEYIEHQKVNQYVINMHAFHNAHLVCNALPCLLATPLPYACEREVFHHQIACDLQGSQDEKRAVQASKAAEKRAKKEELDLAQTSCTKRKCSDVDGDDDLSSGADLNTVTDDVDSYGNVCMIVN